MTNFIESRDIGDSYSIYNEEYSWAEEYSEYYSEDSSSYLMPVFESSSYQFFGEATFYQEASHKGLIAGGILGLVSGAFFMIMKLLKGGGGGSSSSNKSNKSGSSSGNSKKSSSDKPFSKSEPKPKKGVNRTTQDTHVQSTASKVDEVSKENPVTTSDKSKETGADAKGSPKSQTSKKNPNKKEPTQTTTALPELEDEEKIVFNVEIIVNALKKFKKENGNAGTPYNVSKLSLIKEGLKDVSKIVRDMVAITEDDLWYVVSSKNIKEQKVSDFLENKQTLNETISKLQSESQDLGNKYTDNEPDFIIHMLKDIDKLIRSIEEDCKKGMKTCREKRKLEKYKEYVSDIDQVYKILNDVLKGINVVCKNIQNEFKTIRKSLEGKQYKSIIMYEDLCAISFTVDYDSDKVYMERFKRALKTLSEGKAHEMLSMFIKTMIPIDVIQKRLLASVIITDRSISKWDSENKPRFEDTIKEIRKNERSIFNNLKKTFPDYERTFEDVENLAARQLDLFSALVNTPIKDALDKSASEIPAAMKLKEFEDNLEGSISEIVNKMSANKSEMKGESIDQFVDNMPAISFNKFFDNIKWNIVIRDDLPRIIRGDDGFNAFWFSKGIQEVFDAYEKNPDEKKFVDDVHSLIKKHIYEPIRKVSLDSRTWKRVEYNLDYIGYKSIGVKEGDDINLSKKYWKETYAIKTSGDHTPGTIRFIGRMPRVIKINIDGNDEVFRLDGVCSYYIR